MESTRQWEIKSFVQLTTEELYEIVKSRFEVFVTEQEITCENDFDDLDKVAYHIFSREGSRVVAYARMLPKGTVYETPGMGRILVLEQARRRGIAAEMIKRGIAFITEEWQESAITLSAQAYIVPLYRSVGFKEVSDVYEEAGIAHVKMKYKKA
ncbi:MAG: GNAT family N-acetyltransferase [Cellulosilyticaceae bacterium]